MDPRLLLNPGSSYVLKDSDICFYLSVTEEEYSKIVTDPAVRDKVRAVKEEINRMYTGENRGLTCAVCLRDTQHCVSLEGLESL